MCKCMYLLAIGRNGKYEFLKFIKVTCVNSLKWIA